MCAKSMPVLRTPDELSREARQDLEQRYHAAMNALNETADERDDGIPEEDNEDDQ